VSEKLRGNKHRHSPTLLLTGVLVVLLLLMLFTYPGFAQHGLVLALVLDFVLIALTAGIVEVLGRSGSPRNRGAASAAMAKPADKNAGVAR
jgi:hypothetical protein